MLSILIPTYNCNIVALVKELNLQATNCNINFEILAYDDASETHYSNQNNSISNLKNTEYKILKKNTGRSSIRNLLAKKAKYNNLLFVDAGTFPKSKKFIANYLKQPTDGVICGGMINTDKPPKRPFKLRWIYTKKREVNTMCSSNFLIKKDLITAHPFDESLNEYGYEDVLFFNTLINNKKRVTIVKNEVIHINDDDTNSFIDKTERAMENLSKLEEENKLKVDASKILKKFYTLKKFNLTKITAITFKILKTPILKNLNSLYPSLLLFDFYRLGYFCLIKNKK